MSEYRFVEKPLLEQLAALGWETVDQGAGIPGNPAKSRRSSFRDVVLKDELFAALNTINVTEHGQSWLSERQLEKIHDDLTRQTGSLIEANKAVQEMLYKITLDRNEVTGEKSPDVHLIDFNNPENNRFLAMNQFRIDTPGRVKSMIIPDVVLFVNGLPLVVVEGKDSNQFTADSLSEAMIQLWRYSNQRQETKEAGLREGDERLFHFNQFMIATDGEQARVGSITSLSDKYFYKWRSIYPEKYKSFTAPLGKVREQETMVQGMLAKDILLDIVRNFVIFMTLGGNTIKVIPRYQQYRAVNKIVKKIRNGQTPYERSGVVWHTQGSGKSLTMVFLVRKIRHEDDLKSYKVVMINDRTDLEEQLTDTAALTGEKVNVIDDTVALKTELANDNSDLNMVMIHKFLERDTSVPDYMEKIFSGETVPHFKEFGMVNDSEKVLVLIDEAHRTQYGDLGNNLFKAFPHATKVAFTGTPLITDQHTETTIERFGGEYVDKYQLQDAVEDGATIQIMYEGKTANTAVNKQHEFERKFEDLFKDRTPDEIAAIKKKYGAMGDLFEAEARIQEICDDIVEHYATKILPNGFKAQVVVHSKKAAVTYQKCLQKALTTYIEQQENESADSETLARLKFLKTAVVISGDGTNERAEITMARKAAQEQKAVENFKEKFNFEEPDTGIAFLIVCNMLLTGFDAPIEQVMYLDKKISEHNLLQAIARVNRVAEGKEKGYIVDYVGLSNHLKDALSIYAADDIEDILESFQGVESEIPVLEARYQRLLNLFEDAGVSRIKAFAEQKIKDAGEEYQVLEAILDSMDETMGKDNLRRRETFNVYLKKFMSSLDVIMPNPSGRPYEIPAKRFGYIHAKAKQRFKDDSISIAGAGAKVKKLIDEHLIGLGINPKIPQTELFSETFIKDLDKNKSHKSKASEMEHAIRKHCKIHLQEDPAFYKTISEKLDAAIQKYKNDWEQLTMELHVIRNEAGEGRTQTIDGLDLAAAPFFALIETIAYDGGGPDKQGQKHLKKAVVDILDEISGTIDIVDFWNKPHEIRKLAGRLKETLLFSEEPVLKNNREQIVTEIIALAKKREKDLLGNYDSSKTASG